MSKKSGVYVDLDKLKTLYESLKTKPSIEVGVFSNKTGRKDDMTNAKLAAIHEMGAPEYNLPARSTLKVPISDHATEIMATARGKAEEMIKAGGPMRLWKQIGIAAEKIVLQAFQTGGFGKWAPLKYGTLMAKLKGSLKKRKITRGLIYAGQVGEGILIDTGELRRSYSSRVRMRF